MKIVFMGTPHFAVPSLDILVKNGYNVVGVITATDKFGGRGGKQVLTSAVKQYAIKAGIPVLQPRNLKDQDFQASLKSLGADLQVVVAFRMLPKAVWDMPPLGTMNLHGSLLPKYRGAAPINWAIIKGDKETGVTTFFLKHEIDTGDLLFQSKIAISEDMTAGELHDEMMMIGADLVLKSVQAIEKEDYQLLPQAEGQASHAPKIFHHTCQIDFTKDCETVHDFVRGLSPYPTAWTILDGKKLKVFKTKKIKSSSLEVGAIYTDNKSLVHIGTISGAVSLEVVQLEGRKRMSITDFLNGYTIDETTEIVTAPSV